MQLILILIWNFFQIKNCESCDYNVLKIRKNGLDLRLFEEIKYKDMIFVLVFIIIFLIVILNIYIYISKFII